MYKRQGDEVLEAPVALHLGIGGRASAAGTEGSRKPVRGAEALYPVEPLVLGMAYRADVFREAVLGAHGESSQELLVAERAELLGHAVLAAEEPRVLGLRAGGEGKPGEPRRHGRDSRGEEDARQAHEGERPGGGDPDPTPAPARKGGRPWDRAASGGGSRHGELRVSRDVAVA